MRLFTIIIIIGCCFFFCQDTLSATPYYQFSRRTTAAYERAFELRLDEARQLLRQEQQSAPSNLMVELVADYIDFYELMIDGSASKFKQLEGNKSKRLNRLKSGDKASPYHLYAEAEIKIHWALMRSVYGDEFTALREMRSAYKLLKNNQKKHPNFMLNQKSLGMLQTIFSAIPDNYKWGANLLGIDGDFEQGYRNIQRVLKYAQSNDFAFEAECRFMYAFLLMNIKNDEKNAWDIIRHKSLKPSKSVLAAYMKANVAMKTGRNDVAIQLLTNAPQGRGYHNAPVLQYFLGICKLRKLNKSATTHFQNYLKTAHSNDYKKSTYLHLAWYYQIFGASNQQKQYKNWCKTKGAASIYEDKKAMTLVDDNIDNDLLKAQLLLDGGYYANASKALQQKSINALPSLKAKVYHHFLNARIAHQQKKYSKASAYYKKTIQLGKKTKYFYVCYSALKLGEIYEMLKDNATARQYYQICLDQKSDHNESSYHQQAQNGLKRLKN